MYELDFREYQRQKIRPFTHSVEKGRISIERIET